MAETTEINKTVTKIKAITGIENQDETLQAIVELIESRLAIRIGQEKVPDALKPIVIEASISRFNRLTDEGKKSANENDVSATFETDDLAPFKQDIATWISNNKESTSKKVIHFL